MGYSFRTELSRAEEIFFITYVPTLYPSQRLRNVFKINLISVHRISAESTKKPVCEQRSEYEPTQDVSFMAYTIDKEVFLRNFSIHYTYRKKFLHAILIVLRYLSRLRVVLPRTLCANFDEFNSPLV